MTWSEYHEKIKGRPPRPLLQKALSVIPTRFKKTAIDLGCGTGVDTLHLLNLGWAVTAVERESSGIDALKTQVTPELAKNLTLLQKSFESLDPLPKASLIYASLSLPFCSSKEFPEFWNRLRSSFDEECVFAADFFGPEDDWVKSGHCTGHTQEQIRELLSDFEIIGARETKEPGKTALGEEKFWHLISVIARRTLPDDKTP